MDRSSIGGKVFGRDGVIGKLRRRSSSRATAPSSAELWKSILADAKTEFEQKFAASLTTAAQGQNPSSTTVSVQDLRIVSTLGTGSFARVYLVEHKVDHSFYALKVLNKAMIIKKKQVEHTLSEKQIIRCVSFPFITRMTFSFKDNANLYMGLEYVNGGEMFTYLRRIGRFGEEQSRFYAAQLTLVFEYLHSVNVVYRDLKPENLLIAADGYLKVADFGFAKRIQGRTYTLCGTPDYIAPEIVLNKGYSFSVDWWALGVLLFEMMAGYPPFYSTQPIRTYEMIVDGKVAFPTNMSMSDVKDLIRNLLQVDVTRRYGCMRAGASEVRDHKWFSGMDWIAIYLKNIKAPFRPDCSAGPGDARNFEKVDEEQPILVSQDAQGLVEFADF